MGNSNPLAAMVAAKALLGSSPRPRRRFARRRGHRRAESHVFLAEHYVASVDASRLDDLAQDVAAAGARRRGTDVFLLGIVGLPSDESLMSLFAAPGPEAVATTLERAGVPADRVVPVLWRRGRDSKMG
jgi:hypothetical protein